MTEEKKEEILERINKNIEALKVGYGVNNWNDFRKDMEVNKNDR